MSDSSGQTSGPFTSAVSSVAMPSVAMRAVPFASLLPLAACVVGLAAAPRGIASDAAAGGPEALQEVVITASLRRDRLEDLPASITVLDAATVREAGVQHLQDLLPLVPNLNWASGTARPRYFQLRGIGETDQWQGAPNASVGFLIDDMPKGARDLELARPRYFVELIDAALILEKLKQLKANGSGPTVFSTKEGPKK